MLVKPNITHPVVQEGCVTRFSRWLREGCHAVLCLVPGLLPFYFMV